MKERSILLSGEEVRAIREGRQTQIRRVAKDAPTLFHEGIPYRPQRHAGEPYIVGGPFGGTRHTPVRCPYGAPGDQLFGKEKWAVGACADGLSAGTLDCGFWLRENGGVWYAAGDHAPPNPISPRGKWRSATHMPRPLSRIDLEVTSVRVERLQNITPDDVRAEGVRLPVSPDGAPLMQVPTPYDPGRPVAEWTLDDLRISAYACAWDERNRHAPWASNLWTWIVGFKVLRGSL